jgi:hypothetical protein
MILLLFFPWCFFFSYFFGDALVHVFMHVKVTTIVILSHFPPLHVHSIVNLVGANILEYAYLLIALPLLHFKQFIVPPLRIWGSHLSIPMGVHTSPFGIFCGRCLLHFFITIIVQVASNWALAHWLATCYMVHCVATTVVVAFSASFCYIVLFYCCFVNRLFLQESQIFSRS